MIRAGLGHGIVPAKEEFSATEVARILGMSRPTLMRMIDRGARSSAWSASTTGSPASSIQQLRDFLAEDHMAAVTDLANKYRNVD